MSRKQRNWAIQCAAIREKAEAVVKSCLNDEQLDMALEYVSLAVKRYSKFQLEIHPYSRGGLFSPSRIADAFNFAVAQESIREFTNSIFDMIRRQRSKITVIHEPVVDRRLRIRSAVFA